MPRNLVPFKPDAACPKCCCEQVGVTWHRTATVDYPCFPTSPHQGERVHGEHLCRTCDRCRYGWCELPADGGEPVTDARRADNLGSLSGKGGSDDDPQDRGGSGPGG